MAELSGFFNALNVNGVYDRKYNANDYCENLAVIIGNGVLRSANDDLRVTANGMIVTMAAGRAWINGRWYRNTAPLSFATATPPAGGSRYDRIMLRYDNEVSGRKIRAHYVQGVASDNPTKPEPVRSGNIYEIVLADIFVGTNATSLTVTDTRANEDVCGWIYSTVGNGAFFKTLDNEFHDWFEETKDTLASVTIFKRYNWRTVLEAASQTAVFSIPQFDEETSLLEVYVNGMIETEGVEYTRSGNVLTFASPLVAGTEIVVKVYKSIDGTGIETVADEITKLQNQVSVLANTNEYTYVCNGVNDNVLLSEIAQAWLDGGDDYGSKTIRVYGNFGATAAYGGTGETTSPYRWIDVGSDTKKKRRITFDFSCCSQLSFPLSAGAYHVIFYGVAAHIIGANVVAEQTGTDTIIRAFSEVSRNVLAEKCRFIVSGYKNSMVANHGTFKDCSAIIANATGNCYCFLPYANTLLRVIRGEYCAYTGSNAAQSAIIGHSSAGAAAIFDGVSAPTVARDGYYQTHSLLQWTGSGMLNCTDLISALPMVVAADISNIRDTMPYSISGTV